MNSQIQSRDKLQKRICFRPVVLNRWSADRFRSALAFPPVRNNLFQFYTLKRRYQFRSKRVSKEY